MSKANWEFFWLLLRRDLSVRYAGSMLGCAWNLIHPLMLILIYMTIFSSIMINRLAPGDSPVHFGDLAYGAHLCAGLIPWLLFSDILMRSTGTLIENSQFLRRISFPPVILLLTVFINAFMIHACGFLCFCLVLVLLGINLPVSALGGLGIMFLLAVCALGISFLLAVLNVFFRDISQILTVILQLLFWFNPIVYVREILLLPDHFQGTIGAAKKIGATVMYFNPIERFISSIQGLVGVVDYHPTTTDLSIIFLFPFACLAAGLFVFQKTLPEVRDAI
jgi:lipopolysaccharide transport system permease protein